MNPGILRRLPHHPVLAAALLSSSPTAAAPGSGDGPRDGADSAGTPTIARAGVNLQEQNGDRDAQAQYERGAQAYRDQHFQAAIDHFLAADRLAPRAALAYNVARAYEKLEVPARALQYYRDYLRRGPDESNRDQVERRVRELETTLASSGVQQVTVRTVPAGAIVSIDDEVRGAAPWTGELPLGPHQLELRHEGHSPRQATLNLDGGQTQELDLELTPSRAIGTQGAATSGTVRSSANQSDLEQSGGLQPWPWVAIGAGGAALATAGVFELLRRGAEFDAENATYQPQFYDDRERMSSHQTTARVFLGVGAVLIVSGGVLAWIDGVNTETEPAPVALGCDSTFCMGTWMGNF